jgi:glycosidase
LTPRSLQDVEVANVIAEAKTTGGFASPEDWRDRWIYFLLIDRFYNPFAPPRAPDPCLPYQGGTFEGIKRQLPYIRDLGAGAIWLSPVLMNPQWFGDYYGGYATQDFLRIEPRFCRDPAAARQQPELADQELRDLVDAIHAQGMHVILDIVLNHAGDLFDYEGARDTAPFQASAPYRVFWRDAQGTAQGAWTDIENVTNLPREAGIWPTDLQRNTYFRRQGDVNSSPDVTRGDFGRLKELVTEWERNGVYPVRDILIRSYQYLIAKFDLDGFRVDTLKYVERAFARTFANATREFALSIGKKNFFTFGEIWEDDDESKIAEYIGRDTRVDESGIVGFDAALDFPMRKRLEDVCKGTAAPESLAIEMDNRRNAEKTVLSSHGDVSAYLVTFLENHDLPYRYAAGCQPAQVTLALTCLFTTQGIPCLYYGMEQGMDGSGANRESARACLWRDPAVFAQNPQHAYYRTVAALSALRNAQPALRYGRQYYRELTGNGTDFGYSAVAPGILAYSRILNDEEILVVANANQNGPPVQVDVVVDRNLTAPPRLLQVLFSNLTGAAEPGPAAWVAGRSVVPVTLRPMEAQVLG